MNIIIGGGTGFVGRALIPALILSGHHISVIGRDKDKIGKLFNNTVSASTWGELHALNPDDFDAIINLTGENIAAHRWSATIKNKLLSSRIEATKQFVTWAKKALSKKPHLYNASAIGFYGLQKNLPDEHDAYTEQSLYSQETSFASHLVHQWELAALQGTETGIPVTLMRFAVVLKRGEGMLKKLELPAQYGMSTVVGSGNQPLSWIDHIDLVNAIMFLIAHPEITGPVNLVAPELTSQKMFTQTMAKVLKKPAFLRVPKWFIHILFGQMGEELLLSGQAVTPSLLLKFQFNFQYPTLTSALTKEFS